MPKAKNIAGKGTERASQGMPRAFIDRTRIMAVQESKRPRLMRLGTPYAPRPPIVNINFFGGGGGGSEGASGSGGLLACNVSVFCWSFLAPVFLLLFWNPCRCGIRPYAVLGDASWPGRSQPPMPPRTTRPTGPVPTSGPVLQELSDDSDDSKGKGKGQAKGDGKDTGKDPES